MLAVEMRTPPTQCNFQPLLGQNPPALCLGGNATQLFIPMMMTDQFAPEIGQGAPRPALELRRSRWINVFARLKPDFTIQQAEASIAPRSFDHAAS